MADAPSKRLVHPSTLQQMFKDVGYEAKIIEKKARGSIIKDDPGPSHQPYGTRSQSVQYYIFGRRVALCHQYLRPDGTFGASGKPDPKMIDYQGHGLFCHSQSKTKPCLCKTC